LLANALLGKIVARLSGGERVVCATARDYLSSRTRLGPDNLSSTLVAMEGASDRHDAQPENDPIIVLASNGPSR
jgi:hypothetical protein